tara:strand:- start:87 stop:776 length:690 start_codon:yes stop_codon:yes gene_type:complete
MNANGGMSMSNNFLVKFDIEGTGNLFAFYCDEAQLPNVNTATGTIKGRYMGEGQVNYPHTRIFTEMQLGFQCDASMTPLIFLNQWYGTIFGEYDDSKDTPLGSMDKSPGATPYDARTVQRAQNRTVQLNYPDKYCANIYVTKTELGPKIDGGLRTSVTYVMERAWPFAIDAVPLQFGSAQITKVTAQFYYSKHRIVYHDPTSNTNRENLLDFDDPERTFDRGGSPFAGL